MFRYEIDDSKFVRKIVDLVLPRICELTFDCEYELSQIIGSAQWQMELDKPEWLRAGHLFRRLVAEGRLPFEYQGRSSSNHSLYELTS